MRRLVPMLAAALAMAATAPPAGAQTAQDPIYFGLGERLRCPAAARACNDRSTSEPAIRVDPVTGNAYVTDQLGLSGGVNLWSRPAGGRFAFADKIDRIPVVTDRNGYGLGGGDSDLTIGSTGRVFTTSLWAGSVTIAEYDAAGTQVFQSYYAGKPNIDRQWVASYGEDTLFMSHWDFASPPRNIWVNRSNDGGRTWLPPVSAVGNPLSTGGFSSIGNIVVDQASGRVYTLYSRPNSQGVQTLYLARSVDGGASFQQIPVWTYDPFADIDDLGPGARIGTLFPVIAVDRAGNLYVTWADSDDVWFARSLDGGDTWAAPTRINDRSTSRTSVFPWIIAGSEGRVGIAWLGGTAESPANHEEHPFYTYYAQSIDAAGDTPTFQLARVSDDAVHRDGICLSGLACDTGGTLEEPEDPQHPLNVVWKDFPLGKAPIKQSFKIARKLPGAEETSGVPGGSPNSSDPNNRNLAEVVMLAIDADGYALVAYPDDYERGAETPTISVVSKQATGARLYAPGDFPNPRFEPAT